MKVGGTNEGRLYIIAHMLFRGDKTVPGKFAPISILGFKRMATLSRYQLLPYTQRLNISFT